MQEKAYKLVWIILYLRVSSQKVMLYYYLLTVHTYYSIYKYIRYT